MTLVGFSAGNVFAWTANINQDLRNGELNNVFINDNDLGWIAGCGMFGGLCSSFFIGTLCNILGRKKTLLVMGFPCAIGWMVIYFSKNALTICIGRFFTGFAITTGSVASTMYIAESIQPNIRGIAASLYEFQIALGKLYASTMATILHIKHYTLACGVVPVIFFVLILFQPESPIYCLKKNKEDEAIQSLQRLRGKSYDTSVELEQLKAVSLKSHTRNDITFRRAIKTNSSKKACIGIFGIVFFLQASGVTAFSFYGYDIFNSAKTEISPKLVIIIMKLLQTIGAILALAIIDIFNRKTLFIFSFAGMAISIYILGGYTAAIEYKAISTEAARQYWIIPALAGWIYIVAFTLGLGALSFIIIFEILPPPIKETIGSFAIALCYFFAMCVAKLFMLGKHSIGCGFTLVIFGGCSTIAIFYTHFLLIETKGKTLEQIQIELEQ